MVFRELSEGDAVVWVVVVVAVPSAAADFDAVSCSPPDDSFGVG
jgi:hypothetical protein